MSAKKLGLIAALTAAGAVAVGGAALANAATDTSPSPSSSSSSSSNGTSDGTQKGSGRGGGNHTPVTGDEAAKVTAAVKAKDSTVTVESVRKDPDGSYDVLGVKAGNPVKYDVSADLLTITESAGRGGHGGGRGDGERGGGNHTPVTGDEAAKVTAAVKAKDSTVTVDSVRKDPDGSYDVLGVKAGNPVKYDVSADLLTITESAGRGGHGDRARPSAGTGSGTASPSASPTT